VGFFPGELSIPGDQITAIRAGRGYLLSSILGFSSSPYQEVGHFGASDWQPHNDASRTSARTV
jgi:hypothetical protein